MALVQIHATFIKPSHERFYSRWISCKRNQDKRQFITMTYFECGCRIWSVLLTRPNKRPHKGCITALYQNYT
ncbi:hypothetical protein EUGRSUZ_C03959 [Eucalyptus grandis]|uniref:Uncharacterized protein n=2 Tax=Eucalyptus grandis TaxID=71139 RepID=A0ACC3LJN2_EUCGR|nr:hypothetical protein EUGRSUZ_C03959 [Eucalyptus grandis]